MENIADKLAKLKAETSHPQDDAIENVNVRLRHSTLVRVAQRHRLTKEDNSKIIDDAINYYLDSVN